MSRFPLLFVLIPGLTLLSFSFVDPAAVHPRIEAFGEYCERSDEQPLVAAKGGLVRVPAQPANMWSNLAFFFAAAWVLRRSRQKTALAFAAACVVLGLGSAAFHAFVSRAAQRWDEIGMFAVFSLLAVYAVYTLHGYARRHKAGGAASVLAIGLAAFAGRLDSTVVLGILGGIIVAHLMLAAGRGALRWRRVAFVMAPFGLAFAFRWLDLARILCHPQLLFQGHALWHVLAAVGIGLTFETFREMASHEQTVLPEPAQGVAGRGSTPRRSTRALPAASAPISSAG
jgi:hypothetical protein